MDSTVPMARRAPIRGGHQRKSLCTAAMVVLFGVAVLPACGQLAWEQYLLPVANFQTTYTGDATKGDRYFVSCGFVGGQSGYSMTAANVGTLHNGMAWGPQYTSPTYGPYGWNSPMPLWSEVGTRPWKLDRTTQGTPFPAEGSGYATLADVWGGTNMNRFMDGDPNGSTKLSGYLQLYFGDGAYVQSDGIGTTPELVMFDARGDGGMYMRAIKSDQTFTSMIALNMSPYTSGTKNEAEYFKANLQAKGGSTGYQVYRYDEQVNKTPYGVGVDLMAFGVSPSDRIIGYEIWYLENAFCNGPDLVGFFLSKEPTPLPEMHTAASLGALMVAGAGLWRRARRRAV